LFSSPESDELSKKDRGLFVTRPEAKEAIKAFGTGRRILIYGDVGSGKSSLLNLLLYVSRTEQSYMPVRVLLGEQNVKRSVQEILYTVCMEIVTQVRNRRISRPVDAIKKWLLEKRSSDDFYDYMARLIGGFEEEKSVQSKKTAKLSGSIGTGIVPGGSISGGIDSEDTIETRFKSKVENLPSKVIESYLQQMIVAAEKIGYGGIAIGIDEADHIANVDDVVSMLTVSRGIFFASDKQIFVVAGSMELSRRTELTRGVFDAMIYVESVPIEVIKDILDKRIRHANSKRSLSSTFDNEAVKAIYSYSDGLPKDALRLAANALAEATIANEDPVKGAQVKQAQSRSMTHLKQTLSPSERKVFDALNKIGESSPSSEELQTITNLSRQQLDRILRLLASQNKVRRKKVGKSFNYYI